MPTDEALKQIVYLSKPTVTMSISEVRDLLVKSRVNNHFKDVTGMLLFDGEVFLQVLEGPAATVTALFEKIEKDPRHTQFTSLMERMILQRDFGDWSMGLAHIEGDLMKSFPGLMDLGEARKILSQSGAAESLVSAIKFRHAPDESAAAAE